MTKDRLEAAAKVLMTAMNGRRIEVIDKAFEWEIVIHPAITECWSNVFDDGCIVNFHSEEEARSVCPATAKTVLMREVRDDT